MSEKFKWKQRKKKLVEWELGSIESLKPKSYK